MAHRDPFWMTGQRISTMTDDHIENSINYLRKYPHALLTALQDEWERRGKAPFPPAKNARGHYARTEDHSMLYHRVKVIEGQIGRLFKDTRSVSSYSTSISMLLNRLDNLERVVSSIRGIDEAQTARLTTLEANMEQHIRRPAGRDADRLHGIHADLENIFKRLKVVEAYGEKLERIKPPKKRKAAPRKREQKRK